MCLLALGLVAFPIVNNFIQAPFWLLSKIFVFLFVYVWMRGTLPRLRYDQLMAFGWKMLLAGIHRQCGVHQLRHFEVGRHPMTPELLVFFVLAALAVGGALSLIFQKHPIHSALSLIVVMVALAGLYLLMGAEFVAAVQIIVYGGAIMVLFVFVIMLLNAGIEEHTSISKTRRISRAAAGVRVDGFYCRDHCALHGHGAGGVASRAHGFHPRPLHHDFHGFRLSL